MTMVKVFAVSALALGLVGFGPAPYLVVAPTELAAAPSEPTAESGQRAVRIGLQAGHWRANEAPRELRGIRGNGTSWDGVHESEITLAIAERAAELLRDRGYDVDVLPAVVPQNYRADLFIAIHADGSADPNAKGYRVASSRRDRTGRARRAAAILSAAYGSATGLKLLPTTTRRMRNYYAFNHRRYRHSLDTSTPGVIIETGFLTSSEDREVILHDQDRAAAGIVAAIASFPDTADPDR